MGENLAVLNKWKEEISHYKSLKIDEAKKLYKKILRTKDESLKKEYLDQLINGTLYVVSRFIEKNDLAYLNSTSYDMNDIINTCNTIWIEKIVNGQLLNVESFSLMFDSKFYSQFKELLGVADIQISEMLGVSTALFFDLFDEYIKYVESYPKPDLDTYINSLYDDDDDCYYTLLNNYITKRVVKKLFSLYDEIIKSFELSDEDSISISKTTLTKLKSIIINNGIEYSRKPIIDAQEPDFSDKVIKEECRRLVKNVFYSSRLKDRHKTIVEKRFGLKDGNARSLEEISQEFGVTRERIRQMEAKALRVLRHPVYTKKLKSILD